MGTIEDILQRLLFCSISVLFIFEAIILFVRANGNKARKTLAWVILIWGVTYLLRLSQLYAPEDSFPESYSLFRVNVIIVGNYYITLMYLFPMQVLMPGWLNWKRLLLLYLPVAVVSGIYFIILAILGEQPMHLETYSDIWENFGKFNVWYRIILFGSCVIYIYGVMRWLISYENKYNHWINDNFANQEYMDISWMKGYIFAVGMTFVAYVFGLAYGSKFPVLIHSVVVLSGFSYIFYKGLFYESPYPQDFFSDHKPQTKQEEETMLILNDQPMDAELNENSFENRIPAYIESLKNWLETEKPYLYTDFKLTDVSRILPLNRTYLSRVFNEGFGRNFSEVIGSYRVQHSKKIIETTPTLPLYQVAKMSGFKSDSTFIRVFKQEMGISPSQYKISRGGGREI